MEDKRLEKALQNGGTTDQRLEESPSDQESGAVEAGDTAQKIQSPSQWLWKGKFPTESILGTVFSLQVINLQHTQISFRITEHGSLSLHAARVMQCTFPFLPLSPETWAPSVLLIEE